MSQVRMGSSAFAARLAQRYGRRPIGRRLGLTLALTPRPPASQVILNRYTRFGDVVRPRLGLTIHLHRGSATHLSMPIHQLLSPTVEGRDTTATATVTRGLTTSLVERVQRRAIRIEASPTVGPASIAMRAQLPASIASLIRPRPVAMMPLARRSDTRQHAEGAVAPPQHLNRDGSDSRWPAIGTSSRLTRQDESSQIAVHEIERVAERVIGSIDRRIAAQRERLGRF